jgi:hypothetical protein
MSPVSVRSIIYRKCQLRRASSRGRNWPLREAGVDIILLRERPAALLVDCDAKAQLADVGVRERRPHRKSVIERSQAYVSSNANVPTGPENDSDAEFRFASKGERRRVSPHEGRGCELEGYEAKAEGELILTGQSLSECTGWSVMRTARRLCLRPRRTD